MDDRPYQTYLFLYHFPRVSGGGGMEHTDSTAIDVNARVLSENPLALADVTAHEFFHLWNVKRIRPQSLDPVDYTKENYSTALWFSEGLTNTVENYILLRAGLLDELLYLRRIADQIAELEQRPAHLRQSAEAASLDAWLEKYPYYGLPQRSISYYNKGELLGMILDLAVRDASHGSASLREVFRWMNQNYAQQGRDFPDSDGVRQAAEAVSHADFKVFFQKYVAGTEEIPWNDFFINVGLHLVRHSGSGADPGFEATRNFDAPPIVTAITPNSEAERGGLALGDSILDLNGQTASSDFREKLSELRIGDTLSLRVRNAEGERKLHWKISSRDEVEFELKDLDHVTPQQKARRAAWLKGESEGEAHP
jgi:predicted metalloprotease with PDZ domain